MGIDNVRKYFSTHTGDEKKVLDLINFSFLNIDKKKKHCFINPSSKKINYQKILEDSTFPKSYSSEKEVIQKLLNNYTNVINVAHPLSQVNVNPPPTNLSIVASALTAKYNENAVWDFLGQSSAISEVMCIGMMGDLIGYDKKNVGGFFTFGGTASNLYAGKIGLSKIIPNHREKGLGNSKAVFICSELAHYSTKTAAIWLGIGLENLITIPSNDANEMNMAILEKKLIELKKKNIPIACIYTTLGTTDAFGVDPIDKVYHLCKKLNIKTHIHADGVIGWAYLTFSGFNFNSISNKKIAQEIKQTYHQVSMVKYADSVSIDFHKTGWTNYITSCLVIKNRKDFSLLERDVHSTPYLFHGQGYKPGLYTLETSRPNYAQRALVNILAFGKKGYSELILHIFGIREYFRKRCTEENILVLNSKNHFFVTDLRLYPFDVPANYFEQELNEEVNIDLINKVNEYNEKIVEYLQEKAHHKTSTLFSLSKNYKSNKKGHSLYCIKSFPMSPFVEQAHMDQAISDLKEGQVTISKRQKIYK